MIYNYKQDDLTLRFDVSIGRAEPERPDCPACLPEIKFNELHVIIDEATIYIPEPSSKQIFDELIYYISSDILEEANNQSDEYNLPVTTL